MIRFVDDRDALLLAMTLDMTSLHQEVLADAERRSGVDSGRIRVVQSESVTWRDGSLGCPEPGRLYTQALIRGYLSRSRPTRRCSSTTPVCAASGSTARPSARSHRCPTLRRENASRLAPRGVKSDRQIVRACRPSRSSGWASRDAAVGDGAEVLRPAVRPREVRLIVPVVPTVAVAGARPSCCPRPRCRAARCAA